MSRRRNHQSTDTNASHHLAGSNDGAVQTLMRRQLVFGWRALLAFLTLGIGLEVLHGFKADVYLNVANETRRLLWTLAHAHGTLLAMINIIYGLTLQLALRENLDTVRRSAPTLTSRCLIGATILLPGGFFLGGVFIHAGDPGLPVLLVPIGAALLLVGVALAAKTSA